MTRKIAKYGKVTAIVALIVLMVLQVDPALADNRVQADLEEFDQLLDGIGAEVSLTQVEIKSTSDTTETLPAEFIIAQRAYLEAFDEVIRKQIF